MKRPIQAAMAATQRSLLPLAAAILAAQCGHAQTANWIGGNAQRRWDLPENWSPAVVPFNGVGVSYTVLLPADSSATLLGGLQGTVGALRLGERASLDLIEDAQLEVIGTTLIRGRIQADGPATRFKALGSGVVLEANPSLSARAGAAIQIAASGLSWPRLDEDRVLFEAADPGSRVELSQLASLSLTPGNGARAYSIRAVDDGLVDLSGLGTIAGPGEDDELALIVTTGGTIALDQLQQVTGRVRFEVLSPGFEVPRLQSATDLQWNIGTNLPVTAPALQSLTRGGVRVADGAVWNAPQLLRLDSTTLQVDGTGSIVATNLAAFRNGDLQVRPDRDLQLGNLVDIFSSRISVTGGATFRVGAAGYDTYEDWRTSPTLFSASGAGSRLDLSSLQRLSAQGGHGWSYNYSIVAENNGEVDLSGATSVVGCNPGYGNDDWLVFSVGNGGILRLPNLRTVTRKTYWNLGLPLFSLPSLETADNSQFNVTAGGRLELPVLRVADSTGFLMGDGATVNAPELASLSASSFAWGFNSSFDAPKLVQFRDSTADISPGRNFQVPAFSDIFSSRISVSGGRTFRVSATSYDTYEDWRWSPTLFSASGAGSRLDLSSLQRLSAQGGHGWSYNYSIIAENNGEIDLSGATSVIGCNPGYGNDDWLVFSVGNGGVLRLPNLRTVTRKTYWNLGLPLFSLPSLETADNAQFNVISGGRLELPVLRGADSTGFLMGDGATINAPELTSLLAGSFGWGFGSTFNAPRLVQFRDSTAEITPGRAFNVPAFSNIFSSRISVEGGQTFRVSATEYDTHEDWRLSPTLFAARGSGSRLDLSSVQRFGAHGGHGWAYNYSIFAENDGEIDLSGTTSVIGCNPGYGNDDWLVFDARTGGRMKLGSPVISRRARVDASGAGTRLDVGNFLIQSPATLSVSGKATVTVGGDYGFDAVDPNAVVIEGAYFQMNGVVPQRLEVGGRDTGVGGPGTRNFGMSQLIVGETNRASVVRLVDGIDNGQRGGTASPEALYLYGEDGAGLRIIGGSRLVLDGINAYAWLNGTMQRLAALIPEGSNSVRFGDGFLARRGGPRIISQSPSVPVLPPLGALEVTFDMPLKPGSFGPEDVSITGPSGAISVTRVQPLSETTYQIEFGPAIGSGTYALRVGPGIDELAGNLSGMDQDGDGASGHPVGDVYVGSFVVDGQAPQVVGAFTVRGGTRVGIRFNEPLVGEQVGLASNYQVDGVAPVAVEVRAGGRDIVLQVAPITGSDFELRIQDVRDSLGNSGTIASTGTVLPWTQQDLGTPGVDPLEPGWALTFDGSSYEVSAGGSGFPFDRGFLLHEGRVGDFDVRLRLAGLTPKGSYSHAGLIARASLDLGTPYVFSGGLYGSGFNGFGALYRNTVGATWDWWPGGNSGVPLPFPNAWMRLRREGDLFRAYRSQDGTNWTEYAVVTQVLPRTLVVGLAVSSENNAPGASTVASLSALEDLTPGFVTWPQAQSVASGGTALLGATVRGLAPMQFQWYRDGAILPGATASILEIPAVTAEHVGDYRLMVSNAWGTNWSGTASLTVDGVGVGGGLEADVSPGPRGDGAVTIQDWVKTGLLIAGIEAPANSSHFQRADCAPAPCGDGRLSIADWTLAGLYAVSLVEPVPTACGPTTLLGGGSTGTAVRLAGPAGAGEGDRSIWMKLDPAGADGSLTLRIMATWSGGENAAGFSVAFDPARLRFISAEAGAGAGDAIFYANTRRQSDGRLGFAVSRDIGTVFGATTVELARVRFLATGNAAGSLFAFEDSPVPREVVDPGAAVLTTAFVGTSFGPASGPVMDLPRVETDGSVRLAFPAESGSRWVIEASSDLAHWSSTGEAQSGDGRVVHRVPMAPLDARYFRARRLP
jgi:hypothetical protein